MASSSPPPLKPTPSASASGGAPPPLKRGAGGRKGGGKTDPPEERKRDDRDVGDAVEASGAAMRAPTGDDSDDATKGDWLFKQNEMVLGPVTAIVLVERIKAGELSADTPIARDGQPFKPMKLVALFREAHEATVERKKREAEERAYNAAVKRARVMRGLLLAVMFLVPAAGGAVGGHMVMKLQPWDETSDWIAKAPPLVDLPPRPPEIKKTEPVPPPPPVDDTQATEPEQDDPKKGTRVARNDRRDKRDDKRDDKKDDKKDEKKDDKPAEPAGDDKGFVKELTNEQAVAPLKDVKGALGACFKAEIEANPDIFAAGASSLVINLAYTITEEGRSANVEIQNRELRGRPVQDCVKKALSGARWPRFTGERKNVTVPFNIKKPKSTTTTVPVTGTPK